MDFISPLDVTLLKLAATGVSLTVAKSYLNNVLQKRTPEPKFAVLKTQQLAIAASALPPTRSIKKRLEQTGKDCIIFYGSQTGTAEKLAFRLAKKASAKYNLQSIVADLDDYDFGDLQTLPSDKLAIFLLATYGEGEPTDNALAFNQFLSQEPKASVGDSQVKNSATTLRYAAFGLGNSSYRFYNSMIRQVDSVLQSRGATRIGHVGLGDDGEGTLEEDYEDWAEKALAEVAKTYDLMEIAYEYKAAYTVCEPTTPIASKIFAGQPNKDHLNNRIQGPFTPTNPLPARLVEARELFTSQNRNCVHLEFDVSGTTLSYDTGDHVAVWPVNSDLEVVRFLRVFGLEEHKNSIIGITSNDLSVPVPIPSPTTYDSAARHYLDVCAPVSRHLLFYLAQFAPNQAVRQKLVELSQDKSAFIEQVLLPRLNLAQVLSWISDNCFFARVPFSFILENIAKMRPRYYSISSSSQIDKKRISITAVVEAAKGSREDLDFRGVCTNYLLALKPDTVAANAVPTHQTVLPGHDSSQTSALIHVRRSKFRLPRSSKTPIIMVGPGTGVAPFRAFMQERAMHRQAGREVGKSILFYGCRRNTEDFLYKDEWEEHKETLASNFNMYTAFSRESANQKVYVQDLLVQHADELRELILEHNAHVYVCGDASRMAKDVFRAFEKIVGHGEVYLQQMKKTGRWNEDVW